MLKRIRIIVSILVFSLLTFYFLDFANLLPEQTKWLTQIQLAPAILSLSFIIVGAIVVLTLLFGRVYCSSVCPMGVYQDIIAWVSKRIGKRRKRYKYSPAKNILRYSTLVVSIVTYLLGFPVILNIIEPYSGFGRIATNVLKPAYLAGNNLLEAIFTSFGDYTFYKMEIFIVSASSLFIALATFLIIGFMAFRNGRSFCNTICPVGTVLGFLSQFSLFKIRIDEKACTSCRACVAKCKASCIDIKNFKVDTSRCVDCFNCIDSCKFSALSYNTSAKKSRKTEKKKSVQKMDVSKRRFLTSGLTTALTAPAVMAQNKIDTVTGKKSYVRQTPLSPPGSVSHEHFSHHCTSCHLCVSKCPSRVLKPAFMEYGIGGMMQPIMSFEKGYCNYNCTVCSDTCPNGAIKPLTVDEKKTTQPGHVVFNLDICVVKTNETNCGACSEHCPTQAVKMIPYKDGLTVPSVDTSICVGCGGCEYICPVEPYKAIFVEGNTVHQKAKKPEVKEQEDVELDGFGF